MPGEVTESYVGRSDPCTNALNYSADSYSGRKVSEIMPRRYEVVVTCAASVGLVATGESGDLPGE